MNRRFFVLPLLLSAVTANAQAPQSLPPAALAAWQTHAHRSCRVLGEKYVGAKFAAMPAKGVAGGDLAAGMGRYLAAEFNGDGKPDFVVVTPNGGCAGVNEGRWGPQLVIDYVLSTASGYVRDSQGSSDGYDYTLVMQSIGPAVVQRRGNVHVLHYKTGSTGAGRCGPLSAEVVWGWNGRHVDVLEQYNEKGQLVDDEGCLVKPAKAATGAQGKPAAAATPARIPLSVGYYAYVEGTFSTCAKPVGIVMYFDGARFWEGSDFTDPKHEYTSDALKWEMAAADRFRIISRGRDEDGRWDSHRSVNEYAITGPQSFTYVGAVGGPMNAREKFQLCPNIPAGSKFFRGAK
jgi:hypothetical protein